MEIPKIIFQTWKTYNVPDNWKFIMIFTNTKSEETAMEGVLIHMLQPTVNDEIFGQK